MQVLPLGWSSSFAPPLPWNIEEDSRRSELQSIPTDDEGAAQPRRADICDGIQQQDDVFDLSYLSVDRLIGFCASSRQPAPAVQFSGRKRKPSEPNKREHIDVSQFNQRQIQHDLRPSRSDTRQNPHRTHMSPCLSAFEAHKLEANLLKYQIIVFLQKRPFLPAIGVYLVSIAKLSLFDVSTIASATVAARLLLDIPTGYLADRFGRKQATMTGILIASLSPLAYIVSPDYWGGLAGSVLYFGGFAFVSGAHSAFIHDTMQALGREQDYAKFRGRTQSYSLLGNLLVVALVPLTYEADARLPFFIGFLFLFSAFLIACSYTEVIPASGAGAAPSTAAVLRSIPAMDLIIIFSVYGIITAAFDNAQQFREIFLGDFGVPYKYFGLILALSSLSAAAMGHVIHHLATVPPLAFYVLDVLILASSLILIGSSHSPYVVVFGFLLIATYDRNRIIIAESIALLMYKPKESKATLLSIYNSFPSIHGLWVSLALGISLESFGISAGYVVFGSGAGLTLVAALFIYGAVKKRRIPPLRARGSVDEPAGAPVTGGTIPAETAIQTPSP